MLDGIGLGSFLVSFGGLCAAIFFALAFFVFKAIMKKGLLASGVAAVIFGFLGFLISPYIFVGYLSIIGYSL